MALRLDNIYQRPYPNSKNIIRQKEDNEKSSSTSSAESQQNNPQSRSRGLQNVDTSVRSYTPAYDTKFNLPTTAYDNVNINYVNKNKNSNINQVNNITTPSGFNNEDISINVSQIIKDLKNTAIAIGTPDDIYDDVNKYISIIEKQVKSDNPNIKLVKNNFYNAATLLDEYISNTLNKSSQVVYNWVDAIFLQKVDYKYDENSINEKFLVQFPDGTNSKVNPPEQSPKVEEPSVENQEIQENIKNQAEKELVSEKKLVDEKQSLVPQDKELKDLFLKAKRLSVAKKDDKSIEIYAKALDRAVEIGDNNTAGKIYYEVGQIYDNNDCLAQALKSYYESSRICEDENVKTKAHYAMGQIYDDVNQISPAIDHYITAVSHGGESGNLSAQSASLTHIGNIYADMYEKESFDFYSLASDLAEETENYKLKGFVDTNTAKAYEKFEESEKALKLYSKATKNYIEGDSPKNTAKSYISAADIMVQFNKLDKAEKLLTKSLQYARQSSQEKLMSEINTKLNQIKMISA